MNKKDVKLVKRAIISQLPSSISIVELDNFNKKLNDRNELLEKSTLSETETETELHRVFSKRVLSLHEKHHKALEGIIQYDISRLKDANIDKRIKEALAHIKELNVDVVIYEK